MKRDKDLIRKILEYVEENETCFREPYRARRRSRSSMVYASSSRANA